MLQELLLLCAKISTTDLQKTWINMEEWEPFRCTYPSSARNLHRLWSAHTVAMQIINSYTWAFSLTYSLTQCKSKDWLHTFSDSRSQQEGTRCLLHLCLTTDGTGQSNKTEVRAWKTTMVVPRAVKSCPEELDSVSASVPNAKEATNPKLHAGSH